MTLTVRYRSSMCRHTGRLITGFPAIEQSVARILTTRPTELVMLLDFGTDILRHLGKNIHRDRIVSLYMEAVNAIHKWEPEYRIRRLQLVRLERAGTLGIGFTGIYYPEGRFGNYEIAEEAGLTFPNTGGTA